MVAAGVNDENNVTETECVVVDRQQYSGGNGGQNGMRREEVGTFVSSTIENAIKRMNAVDEIESYPGNEDQGTASCT